MSVKAENTCKPVGAKTPGCFRVPRLCLWFCGVLLPFFAVAADASGEKMEDAGAGTSQVPSKMTFSSKISDVLSNWPTAGIETGYMSRAILKPGQKMAYKWANSLATTPQGEAEEQKVPGEFALPPPRGPRGMFMVPGCKFVMGFGAMPAGNEAVALKVTSFYMDAYDVPGNVWTEVRQWAILHGYTNLAQGQNGAKLGGGEAGSDHPVVMVTWYDCVKWCNARSEKEFLLPAYYVNETQKQVYRVGDQDLSNICVDWTANGYRLPTEVEWEMAARGGVSGQLYPWGDRVDGKRANYSGGDGSSTNNGTTPIGTYRNRWMEIDGKKEVVSDENGYGMHDMAGNVYQWCWDWYGPYSANICGPATGAYRVMRGGCWASVQDVNLTCGFRNAMRPGSSSPYVGFRCVRKH